MVKIAPCILVMLMRILYALYLDNKQDVFGEFNVYPYEVSILCSVK